jgi:hypothetical protein
MKRLHVLVALVAVVSLGVGGVGVSPLRASDTFTIVDTLGPATPTTKLGGGGGGMTISAFQSVGPQFTLTQRTVITEIGGFIADGGTAGTQPVVVQVRPSVNGQPDASTVLATFELSSDNDRFTWSYESVAPNLTLGAGSYFALFAEPEGSSADHFLVGYAFSPFDYRAGSPTLGALCSGTPCQISSGFPAAVRILGRFNVDTTPPVLMTPGSINVDAASSAGTTVGYVATATDDTDSNPKVTCDPPSGSVFPIGTTTVRCSATDASGNEALASFDVQVKGAAEQLADLRGAVDGVDSGTSLAHKVVAAQAAYTAGDAAGACGILRALLNQLQAQSGKSILAGTGTALIADAIRIRAVLSC